ncbi:MAG: hypothetical protein CMD07_04165 [Flavobacteriales bacterium]|nr:hypothetical protein [Flavobacteriales bacterium]
MMKYSKELVIGLSSILTIICFIWGYNFLKGKNIFNNKTEFYALYEHVHGLETGQPVTFKGLKVGQVLNIIYEQNMNNNLLVHFNLTREISFSSDSKINIYDIDIMGSKGLEIIPGYRDDIAENGDTLVGSVKISITDQLTNEFLPIKDGTESLLKILDSTLFSIINLTDNINLFINENNNKFSSFIYNIDTLSYLILGYQSKINSTIKNLNNIIEEINNSNLTNSINKSNDILGKIDYLLNDINKGRGNLGKITKDSLLYNEVSSTLKNLKELLKDMKKNPKRYVNFSLFGRKTEILIDTLKH